MDKTKEENLIILYTLYILEKRYHFSFGPYHLVKFLKGGIFKTIKMQHLYMIPTYGSLKDTPEIQIKDNIENLIDEGFLLKNSLPDFYSKKVLVLTKKAQEELFVNRREIKNLLIKYFKTHYSTLLQKGEKYLHLPRSKEKSHTKDKVNWGNRIKYLKAKYPKYGKPWSELDKEKAIEMYKKGRKVKEISSELGRNGDGIRSVLRKNGVLDNISSSQRNLETPNIQVKDPLSEDLIIGDKPEIIDERNIHLAFKDIENAFDNLVEIEGGNGLTPENAIKYSVPSPDYYLSSNYNGEDLELRILKNFFKIFGFKFTSIAFEDTFFDHLNEKAYKIYTVNIGNNSIRYFFDVTQEQGMDLTFELLYDFIPSDSDLLKKGREELDTDNTVRYEESIEDEDEDGDDEEAYESIAYEKEDKFQEFGSEAYYYPYEDEDEDGDDEDGMHWDGDEWVSN